MDSEKIALERLEDHALQQLKGVGIDAEKRKDGVLGFDTTVSPDVAVSRIQGAIPHAAVETQPNGTGTTGTVKVADVKRINE